MKNKLYILSVFITLFTLVSCGKRREINTGRFDENKFTVRFDLNWDAKTRAEVAGRYGIDSLLIESVYKTPGVTLPDSLEWKIGFNNGKVIDLWKETGVTDIPFLGNTDVLLLEDRWVRRSEVSPAPDPLWGVNYLSGYDCLSPKDSVMIFKLKNHKGASSVFIAGSFNNWSTMANELKKNSEGEWEIELQIEPGKFRYKYVVDGKWFTDPANPVKERTTEYGTVSAGFMPNHYFVLTGFNNAKKVVVTGSFNRWSRAGIAMEKAGEKWILPIYLKNGTWAYKFIVDGKWMPDPGNPDLRKDADGNENSFISTGKTELFRLNGFADAEKVLLSGSFNKWSTNELLMQKDSAGWKLDYAIGPGIWEYKFIVDGHWMPDPENPFKTGFGQYENSVKITDQNFLFRLKGYENARKVVVTGSFCNWDPDKYRMLRSGNEWIFPVYLPKGKHLYKFVVDGTWMIDPDNEVFEDNQYGTGNSVLWIE